MAKPDTDRTDRELVARIGRAASGKAGYKQLVRELGLGGGRERRLLLEQLQRLVGRRELVEAGRGIWALPQTENAAKPLKKQGVWDGMEAVVRGGRERLVSGRLDLHRDGFGFVRPDAASGGKGEDIFIAPNEIHGAMQGDVVLVDEAPVGRDGRRSGRIARVLTRRNPTVVGIFHYADSRRGRGEFVGNYVVPVDDRVASMIAIMDGDEIVAAGDDSPHRMLGEGARKTSSGRSLEGMAVDVEITSFPGPGRPARGRVIEVLGPPDAFGVDVEIVIRKHHVPHTFPAAVLAEAESIAEESREELAGLGRTPQGLKPLPAGGSNGTAEAVPLRDNRTEEVTAESGGGPLMPQVRGHEWGTHQGSGGAKESQYGGLSTAPSASSGSGRDDKFSGEVEREDFRGLPIVTIDGETARDFDDAVLVRELANGNTELQVHIADVSWYVRPGSALDTEARVRGTSVYFPDRAVPMLPHALSSGMCSLLPDEDRLVLSCVMEIDARGEVVGYRVSEGVIRSVRRCTYTSVQCCLNAGSREQGVGISEASVEDIAERERVEFELPGMPEAFDRMLELALRLNAKRVRRGSIDFDLPEPVVEFDPDGNMQAIVRSERGWAHRLIEEFMLSANECVATWLERQGIASIYRIHEMPDPKRIVEFEETASGFGHSLGIGSLPVRKMTMKADRRDARVRSSRGRDSRAAQVHEIPESIPVTPQMYQKLVRRIAGTPEERTLAYLMLRSLKQARYAEKNEGHFALASPSYTHFTSPIRRYPDLIVHRLVRAMLRDGASAVGGAIRSDDAQPWAAEAAWARGSQRAMSAERVSPERESPIAAEELNDIAVESSQAERRAADAERELIEWKKMKFMADKVGDEFHATVLSCTKYGFFVELDDLFIEGLVPLQSLVGDHYSFRDTDRTIAGARSGHVFGIGQRVEVLLDRIDQQQRRLQFALVPGTEPKVTSLRTRTKKEPKGEKALSPKRGGKAKTRARNKKNKGRR